MIKVSSNIEYLKKDLQFILPVLICLLSFILINIIQLIDISQVYYSYKVIINQPYRIIFFNFVHKDFTHLLSNIFGIVIIRYSFLKLRCRNNKLFFYLVLLIIPIQSFYLLIMDIYIFNNYNHFLVGFSGIIFGANSFLLLSSYYGNKFILNISIGLKKNLYISKLMFLLLSLGISYSFLPGISLTGHLAGALSGLTIFYLNNSNLK